MDGLDTVEVAPTKLEGDSASSYAAEDQLWHHEFFRDCLAPKKAAFKVTPVPMHQTQAVTLQTSSCRCQEDGHKMRFTGLNLICAWSVHGVHGLSPCGGLHKVHAAVMSSVSTCKTACLSLQISLPA